MEACIIKQCFLNVASVDKRFQQHRLIRIFSLLTLCLLCSITWSIHSGQRWNRVCLMYTHLGSLTRQFYGSFVVYVLGVSRHFRTTWWTRGTNVRLFRPRWEKARANTVLPVSALRAFSLDRACRRCENNDRGITWVRYIGAFCRILTLRVFFSRWKLRRL